jgi:hypothetical protein
MQYKQDDIKYKFTDIKQRGTWWQKVIIPAMPIAGKKYRIIWTDIRKLFKICCLYIP